MEMLSLCSCCFCLVEDSWSKDKVSLRTMASDDEQRIAQTAWMSDIYTGVSFVLSGVTLQNNSFLDVDDIPSIPRNGGARVSDNVLLCRTDLVKCCNSVLNNLSVPLGDWYYPNGSIVEFDIHVYNESDPPGPSAFRRNRGQSVVRLWRRGDPSERGHFRCEIPNAANVSQNIYVNIRELN